MNRKEKEQMSHTLTQIEIESILDFLSNSLTDEWHDGYNTALKHVKEMLGDYIRKENEYRYYDVFEEDNLSDVEADAMTLRDCGMGTDEDYGYYDDVDGYFGENY